MTKLIHKEGDIFTSTAQALGHGVNVCGLMGAGIALQFRKRFPDMYLEYQKHCLSGALNPGDYFVWTLPDGRQIYNLASQDRPGANAQYAWLEWATNGALDAMDAYGIETLALPRIGSGIGGLDEYGVEEILKLAAESHRADIELWTYSNA